MKTKLPALEHSLRLTLGALILPLIPLTSGPAQAASLSWDTSVSSGDWDLATSNWLNGGTPTAWSQTSTTSASNDAVFGGADGTYAISLSGTQIAAHRLQFNASGYTLTGGTLYLSSVQASPVGTGTSSVAAGKTATINSFVASPNNALIYFNVNGVLNFGGGMGTGQVNLIGSGTTNITGGTWNPSIGRYDNSAVNQTAGVVNFNLGSSSAGYFLGYSAGRNTNYTISGGTMSLNGGAGAFLAVGRNAGGNTARLTITDDAVVNVGTTAGKEGRINVVSNSGDGSGWLDVQGGTLNVGTAGASADKIYLFTGGVMAAGRTAKYTQSGGTATVNGFTFGNAGTTSATASILLTGGQLYIGSQGITKNTTNPSTSTVTLGGGTLGAHATWSSSHPMILSNAGGGVTIRAADAAGTARDITLSGALSGAGAGFTKTGAGTLTLSGSNSYSGVTTLSAGVLSLDNADALAGGGNLTFTGGTLQHTANNTADLSARITNSTSAVAIDTNGQNVSYGAIDNTNTGGLTKAGTGVLTLTGNNGYTGLTTVSGGTLALGSGAVVAATTSGPTISNGSVLQVGNGAVFNSSGIMRVTGTSSIVIDDGGTFNATQSGGVVQFVADATTSATNAGVLAGSGTGSVMNVTSTFFRPAGVNNARYNFNIDNVLVSATNSIFEVGRGGSFNAVTLANGAVVRAASAVVSIDAYNYTLNVNSGASLVLNNGNFTLKSGGNGANTAVNINGGTITGVNAVTFNSAPNSSINITNGGLLSSKTTTIAGTNALVSVSGTGSSWVLNGGLGIGITSGIGETVQVVNGGKITANSVSMASGSTTFIFDNGTLEAAAAGTLLSSNGTVSVKAGGAILNSANFNVTVSAALTEDALSVGGGLTKLGSGTMTLSSAANSFTGNTTISEGRLVLADNAQLLFKIGASGVNNSINGVGAVTLNGDFNFDLSGAATTGSWNIVDVANLEETFGASFSVVGFGNVGNLWSKQVGDYTYTFNEDTGMLLVIPEPNTWAMLVGGFGMLVSFQRLRRRRVGTL